MSETSADVYLLKEDGERYQHNRHTWKTWGPETNLQELESPQFLPAESTTL
jgi:hypothetical protein